ncbi:MAG TPA: phage tail protein, partial [Pyrinomonadaceae bacterium]|nr:phage tail protein [Pyrinomonadaceae bacterium]
YWIDESGLKIRALSSGSRMTTDFWRLPERCACPPAASSGNFQPLNDPAPLPPIKLSGLAVTENHYLAVGTSEPAGLLIFDLYSGGEPRQIFWPAESPFAPFDMAPRPGGGVWILDRENRCYWAVDRNFNVIGPDGGTSLAPEMADEFQPIDGSSRRQTPARGFPGSFSLLQSPGALIDPIAIEALPDETVLILDYNAASDFSQIHRYRYAERLPDEISTDAILGLIDEADQTSFKLIGYDIAFVPEHLERGRQLQDRLYVVGADGNQTYAFRVCLRDGKIELQPLAEYLPMRLFGGKALVATDSGAYYDFAEDWIPLAHQRRPRYAQMATLLTPVLDGRDPDCVWHRLMLDACISPEAKVEVWSRAANDQRDLDLTQWQLEPGPNLRATGSEIPFLRSTRSNNGGKSSLKLGEGTWELLFQRARGRYLQLKLRLSGDERNTPRLSALRAYYPRFSYVTNYLPAVYREDDQSASFLDRYLANVEGIHTALEDRIASAQILFDVRSAPSEVLDWLASWFDVALDPSWDEPKRRVFIAHAMEFFQFRGTIRGLTTALHLALDACANEKIFTAGPCCSRREDIRIIEKYLTRKMPAVTLGDPSDATGLRTVATAATWSPEQGRANLSQRYSTFIDSTGTSTIQYPLIAPADANEAEKWAQFSQATLGFVPSIYAAEQTAWQIFLANRYGTIGPLNSAHQTVYPDFAGISLPRDLPKVAAAQTDWIDFVTSPTNLVERRLWQDFLARRYRRAGALNDIYGTAWTGFDTVALPGELPKDGAPLNDWFQFETVVLRMQGAAHRFTVLLPVPAALAFNTDEHQTRLALARRIVDLEKPAHTVFDVRFYWAMFRVGEARLQLDTVIDQGSRAPQLLPNLILGQGFVGESYLAPSALEDASDRNLLGRDALGPAPK